VRQTEQAPGGDRPRLNSEAAIRRAADFLCSLQADKGAWPGDYGGPMFLLPLYVATCHGTGVELDARTRSEMARYLRSTQRADGGWGLHYEGHSHVFTTALCYVALRLLGAAPSAPNLERARAWLHAQGGPVAAAAWGKFALALLGLYE